MRLCFIIEEKYRHESMPLVVADQLRRWGHDVDLLEPHAAVTCLFDLVTQSFDAYVLKTASDGPGLSILQAAEAAGIPTINNARAIRLVRDKAVAIAVARAHGLPIPPTYFVAHPRLLTQIPPEDYPLVVKPSNGRACRDIYRVTHPADLATLALADDGHAFLLAQRYVANPGFDIKLYVTGPQVYAVRKKSPLHPDVDVTEGLMPVTPELRTLALNVGAFFGLDIYGVDVVQTPAGWVGVDINDFPSFGLVPDAVARIAQFILQVAQRAEMRRTAPTTRTQRRPDPLSGLADAQSVPTTQPSTQVSRRLARPVLRDSGQKTCRTYAYVRSRRLPTRKRHT
jgi:ribosomal protein S6--L-glutamate ligase